MTMTRMMMTTTAATAPAIHATDSDRPSSVAPATAVLTVHTLPAGHRKNMCSAVAEMGDRLATIDMGQKDGGCCAPFGGKLGPH